MAVLLISILFLAVTAILLGYLKIKPGRIMQLFALIKHRSGQTNSKQNAEKIKTLALALAFEVSTIDGRLFHCEIDVIKKWAKRSVDFSNATEKTKQKFEKSFDKTVSFFQSGNKLETQNICKELVKISTLANRYDILELCLHVANAKGLVNTDELSVLNNLADWLEVDKNRFHSMLEKRVPVNMCEVEDVETILGLTSNMTREQTRQYLNDQYRKWNARVTSSDPQIQSQADSMLKFIAEARSSCLA